jgi:hypothetical protein
MQVLPDSFNESVPKYFWRLWTFQFLDDTSDSCHYLFKIFLLGEKIRDFACVENIIDVF